MSKAITKTKRKTAKVARTQSRPAVVTKRYDAKRFTGKVKSFADLTLEDIKAWRDDN